MISIPGRIPIHIFPFFWVLIVLIGWLNSQGHEVDAQSLLKYPNHFSPAGMDFFALPNEKVERRNFYSLIGIGGQNLETVRNTARSWLELGESNIADLKRVSQLPAAFR